MKDCETAPILNDPFESVTDSSCCAEEFVAKLDALEGSWKDDAWIFRGQNNANWELQPSLYRNWKPEFGNCYEFRLVDTFILNANLAQLDIPSNTLNYATYWRNKKHATSQKLGGNYGIGFSYDFTHAVFAIAQHSGIPTRLLDFSYNPLVAAFFAWDTTSLEDSVDLSSDYLAGCFEEIAQIYEHSPSEAVDVLRCHYRKYKKANDGLPEEMAVWALRSNGLERKKTALRVLHHPHTEISNLRAQEGVFVFQLDYLEGNEQQERKTWPSFNDEVLKLVESQDVRKLTLPRSEEDKLWEILERKRMGTMYLKPTYEDVANAAKFSVEKSYKIQLKSEDSR